MFKHIALITALLASGSLAVQGVHLANCGYKGQQRTESEVDYFSNDSNAVPGRGPDSRYNFGRITKWEGVGCIGGDLTNNGGSWDACLAGDAQSRPLYTAIGDGYRHINGGTEHYKCYLDDKLALRDDGFYQALSYVWGPEKSDKYIQLNGVQFQVRENLYDCLWHLRKRGGAVLAQPLWVDAICINQADLIERNRSVLLMSTIYRSATKVISWLGSDKNVVAGMVRIQEIARRWVALEDVEGAPNPFKIWSFTEMPKQWRDWLRDTYELWEEKTGLDGLVAFFLSDYWRRIWIVQEILLANFETHELICGAHRLTSSALDVFTVCVQNLFSGKRPSEVGDAWTSISLGIRGECKVLVEIQLVGSGVLTPSLMLVLYIASTRQCSDPRDAVYGVLDFIPHHGIVPDYSKSVREVYMDWATKAMNEDKSLELLSFVENGGFQWSDRPLDLPSWTPDLYNVKYHRSVRWYKKETPEAGQSNLPAHSPLFQVLPGDILKVKGFLCGTVGEAKTLEYRPLVNGEIPNRGGDSTGSYVRFCMDYLVKHMTRGGRYKTNIPPLQALIRITMNDRLPPPNEEWDLTSRSIHEVAGCFITWLCFGFFALFKDNAPPGELWEVAAGLMGLSFGEKFPESYQESVFPGIDVRERFQWPTLDDVFRMATGEGSNLDTLDYMVNWCDRRRMLETENGYLGYGQRETEPGDLIYSIEGCSSLLALRLSDGGAQLLATEQGWEAEDILII
ncbi:hypothetical protein GQ53DRAFT_808076 [Thozetella sp. PMI_491]|nr:hypothetical protein GQ53DRAFT_808076 [Thozetella sp. PMI_491]